MVSLFLSVVLVNVVMVSVVAPLSSFFSGLFVQAWLRPVLHRQVRRLRERDGQHVRPLDQRLHPEARRGVQQHPRRKADRPGANVIKLFVRNLLT